MAASQVETMPTSCEKAHECPPLIRVEERMTAVERQQEHDQQNISRLFDKLDGLKLWIMGVLATAIISLLVLLLK